MKGNLPAKTESGDISTWKEVDRSMDTSDAQNGDASRKKKRALAPLDTYTGQESLLSYWTKRMNYEASRKHPEFSGRLLAGSSNIAPLYLQLNEKQNQEDASSAV